MRIAEGIGIATAEAGAGDAVAGGTADAVAVGVCADAGAAAEASVDAAAEEETELRRCRSVRQHAKSLNWPLIGANFFCSSQRANPAGRYARLLNRSNGKARLPGIDHGSFLAIARRRRPDAGQQACQPMTGFRRVDHVVK
jgi:hypothetical protein